MTLQRGAPWLVMGPCIIEIDHIVICECRNEEIIVKRKLWVGLVTGPCIAEIDRIVIREVQYQFEVNWRRNEEIIVKGNFGWVWSMWAGRLNFVIGAMHKVNRCRNEEIIVKGNFGWAWSMWAGRPIEIECIVIRDFQGSRAYSVGGDRGQDGRKTKITTISPLFLRKAW
ncbi:hypothetical protein DPMN_009261 [Dreissena polymorpha]|uniref:Uncharacterized protein n=1 Tax=Dreissena polymorpha TaxID=45954 RepID=A0A9D4RZY9_DREPO|nr:hypothetical protein DPMN_009261 [Dreissena polymorpha]